MLQVYANSTDVTQYLERNTIRIAEQLNNRANTCSFILNKYDLASGVIVNIFEGFELTAQANSGQADLVVDNTYELSEKFRPGDELILDIKWAGQIRKIIDSINHTTKTITLTTNLPANLSNKTKCWRLVFSWVTLKNPNEEFGMSGTFSYKVNVVDWTKIFDAKNIADTYEDMYAREMMGRIVYDFCANDNQTNLSLFESGWTQSGLGLAMANETTDRIQGSYAQKTGTSGIGTALWTQSITSVDLTGKDHFRLWFKIKTNYGDSITSIKYRVGTDSSNYFEGSSDWVGSDNENCWNFAAFRFDRATIVGSPDISDIAWLQIEVVCTATIPTGNIIFDHSFAAQWGFTIQNVIRGDRRFVDVRVAYKKPTMFFEELAKLQGFFWFVDYERDIHLFRMNNTPSPLAITDSSENYSDLVTSADISQLKNRQTVRGGEAVDSFSYEQVEVCDGKVESWRLDYKPKALEVYVDTTGTGASYVLATLGIENLDDPALFDYVYNFQEKVVRRASASILPIGTLFKRVYFPYKPIRVRVENNASIVATKALLGGDGIFEWPVISDASIKDWNEARIRARSEVNAYANAILSADFTTEIDGLTAWQIIHITDTSRGIDEDFLIQKVSKESKNNELWKYKINAGSTMFGIIEFFQMLLKKTGDLTVNVNEQVDIVKNIDETLEIEDVYTFTQKIDTFYAHSRTGQYSHTLNFTEGWTPNDAYCGFSQVS